MSWRRLIPFCLLAFPGTAWASVDASPQVSPHVKGSGEPRVVEPAVDPVTAAPPTAVPAADTLDGEWDSPRVLELVRHAIDSRRHAYSDSVLQSFEAEAEGHVFYLAEVGPDAGEARPVRADQVALRVRWQAPDRSMQTLVGRRHERRLPTRIRYHIDHLSLILENFGDRIDVGEGDEVSGVLHPVARGAPGFYEYRLADSVSMTVGGRERRLHRVEVRPRDLEEPGVVGEIFLEAGSGAVVRMRFTFTPSAYLDPTVESIRVDLQSALWEGRHWLPAEQTVTIRREARFLDFPLAGTIRVRFRVLDYDINLDPAYTLAPGHRVNSLPPERLAAYDGWTMGLYEVPGAGELGERLEEDELRRQARELAEGRFLGGGGRLAAHFPDLSSTLRVRRAEGVLGGAGGRYRPDDASRLAAWVGHPVEKGGLEADVAYHRDLGDGDVRLETRAYVNRFSDAGVFPAASGLVSSLGFVFRGEDFTDPWFRHGLSVQARLPAGPGTVRVGGLAERHRSADLVAMPPGDGAVRPVRPIREGDLGALRIGYLLPPAALSGLPGGRWKLDLELEGATRQVGDFGFTRGILRLQGRAPAGSTVGWRLHGGLGGAAGDVPPQRLLLLGGRGTVPGHGFRQWGGESAGFLHLEVSRPVVDPWLALRGIAAAGWVARPPDEGAFGVPPDGDPGDAGSGRIDHGSAILTGSGGVRPSLGMGLGLVDGVLRVDAVRGLRDGRWEWMVSVDPGFWGML